MTPGQAKWMRMNRNHVKLNRLGRSRFASLGYALRQALGGYRDHRVAVKEDRQYQETVRKTWGDKPAVKLPTMVTDRYGVPVVCDEYADDGRTRRCRECGWWRSSHYPPPSGEREAT